jgi:hypothetical protein
MIPENGASASYDAIGNLTSSATVQVGLKDVFEDQVETKSFNIKSSSLAMQAEKDSSGNATGNLLVNIEWGTF